MKKLALGFICLFAGILLTACGVSDAEATKSLSNQLDRVESVVSSTSSNEVVDVSPNITYDTNTSQNSIQIYKIKSYENMTKEESLRQSILSLNAHLKSCKNQKYKLGKSKAAALKNISENISTYVSKLNETKARVKNSVSSIKKNINSNTFDSQKAESNYISLNNSMNERYAYLSNIYANLEQAHKILGCCTGDECATNNSEFQSQTEKRSIKNIDTLDNKKIENANNNATTPNNMTNNGYNNYRPNTNNPNFYPPYNQRFNPNRNTDTFYPQGRNIDTYRFNPNGYNGYNGYYYNQISTAHTPNNNEKAQENKVI